MNLRHAAALALVGWYLMVPPQAKERELHYMLDTSVALSKWYIFGSYDSAEQCKDDLYRLSKQSYDRFGQDKMVRPETKEEARAAQYVASQCIATDDPRLAK